MNHRGSLAVSIVLALLVGLATHVVWRAGYREGVRELSAAIREATWRTR